jgi:hypothetical protein
MSSLKNLALSCLNEMQSGEFKTSYETVLELISYLEEKSDPNKEEIKLTHVCYEFVEKFQEMQSALHSSLRGETRDLLGSRLQKLYDRSID